MLNRLFGALAVAVGVGAVVAVKLLKDQKETENKEVEDDDNEVHFITLSDGDGVAQPTYDASDRSPEVQEVCGVYPYLNPDFVEELLAEASSLNGMFEQDTLVTIHHYVSFDNEKNPGFGRGFFIILIQKVRSVFDAFFVWKSIVKMTALSFHQ